MIMKIWMMFLTICFPGGYAKEMSKLIGGSLAEIEDYPYQVSVRSNGYHICGGSIISDIDILTAASCIVREIGVFSANIQILIGTNDQENIDEDGIIHDVNLTIFHEDYSPDTLWINDIAILKLTTPIFLSRTRAVIPLSKRLIRYGTGVHVSGWGGVTLSQISTKYLRFLFMRVLRHEVCIELFERYGQLDENQNCAAMPTTSSAISQGDAGNPIVQKNELIGIVSASVLRGFGHPVLYTPVRNFLPWIKTAMESY